MSQTADKRTLLFALILIESVNFYQQGSEVGKDEIV
jgi:hypothetical protein